MGGNVLGNSLNIYQRMSYIVFGIIFIFFLGGGGVAEN